MKNIQTNRLLVVVVLLQGMILCGQWLNGGMVSTAQAQVPDGGSQRQQTIEELRSINAKLEHIGSVLESGKLQVRMAPADAKKE